MPKTKIVCTIGPSSVAPGILRQLIREGMTVARLNFSHGTPQEHEERVRVLRRLSEEEGRPVAVLQDLAGPKIRVGWIPDPGIRLEPGDTLILTGQEGAEAAEGKVPLSFPDLPRQVGPQARLLLADGTMEVIVREVRGKDIHCEVVTGGLLTSHKGINLPDGTLDVPSLTDKDIEDLGFGLEIDVDFVALSFVRSAEDILRARAVISQKGDRDVPLIAKIEKHEAIRNLDEIIEAADGIMVARGDLGVEIPLEEVPNVQKQIIRKANLAGKPVITATQMLRSMVDSPRPTRAEATDVANAVLDGTDAVMLSEETAAGAYPVESVRFMVRILESAENHFPHDRFLAMMPRKEVSEAVAHASCLLAEHLEAAAIVAPTRSGLTARNICRFRPARPLLALSPSPRTVRRLCLYWGCIPRLVPSSGDTDEMIRTAAEAALESGLAGRGERVVITSGHPVWVAGTTNMVRIKTL
ncbi:MAG: pyruvate kinase [Deltaproteobacteria bacterium]|nr:pyruvate kinase [Deltaproteobacteria bacterium]MBW2017462.1 pyruvate kinase [Deltaproteobacteria bacterium]MBW2130226.1 pyruvate kinase [Deltaproteobacteria bacterium]